MNELTKGRAKRVEDTETTAAVAPLQCRRSRSTKSGKADEYKASGSLCEI